MNRFHVHLNVTDLEASLRFYTGLFATPPTVLESDYAKWMLDDPRVNFAISRTGRAAGIDHLGIQADSAEALHGLGARLDAAGGTVVPEAGAVCCYARSDKYWTEDPQGTRWETFHTLGRATTYHAGSAVCASDAACAPDPDASAPTAAVRGAGCGVPKSGCC